VDNKAAYAVAHHYDLAIVGSNIPHHHSPPRNLSWQKILLLRNIVRAGVAYGANINKESWILMIDSDAFITNMTVEMDSIVASAHQQHGCKQPLDLIIARDCNGPNAGVFLLRVSEWSLDFLNQIWSINNPDVPAIEAWWENAALVYLLNSSEDLLRHVHIADQKQFNSYSPIYKEPCFAKWAPGDFVYHFVAGSKHTELKNMVDHIQNVTTAAYTKQ
jgi:hypothetical protein